MAATEVRRLSVVVPAHNNSGQLHESLKALRGSRYQGYEIIRGGPLLKRGPIGN